jgi:tripartite-type tricarboxylate transporter receptor subunit TctC
MKRLLALCGCLAGLALAGPVAAQAYPTKPIRIVVPFLPGGPSDFAARAASQNLQQYLGQPVIVENRAGSAGITGTDVVAKAAPDGYTLLVATVGVTVIAPFLFNNLPYDPLKDFVPITNLIAGPAVLVVHPSVPAKSVQELIALAKAKPGFLTYGSTGPGQISHLNGELFKTLAGVDILHVPYKGAAPLLPELLGGQIMMNFSTAVDGLNQVRAGKLRALAVTSLKRLSVMPDVPTMDEAGLKGYEVSNWNAIYAPAKTPRAIVDRLQRDIARAMDTPEIKERVAAQGNIIVNNTPDEFAAFVKAEAAKWSKVIKDANIKAD